MWIKRQISKIIEENTDPVQIIRGPRQCGKSSLVLRLDSDFKELSLDDPSLRDLAQNDPELFLSQFSGNKLFIDEAQYAPNLFPSIKRRVDLLKRENKSQMQTIIRLTGSNQILMDKYVKESLAGRASFFDMCTLSFTELLESKPSSSVQNFLYTGGWPELHANESISVKKYLDDYISSYVEKDIVLSAGIQKTTEFTRFLKLLAGRTAELINFSSIANDVGVDTKTIKEWTSVLERMGIIALVQPYYNNLSKRLIKTPKIYFLDTGLACRLQGWTSPEPILTSPLQGHLFENLVFCELFKYNQNLQLGWQIFHWRSKEGEEIDFLIQKNPKEFIFVEAKISSQAMPNICNYPEVKKVFKDDIPKIILCHQEGNQALNGKVPLRFLVNEL